MTLRSSLPWRCGEMCAGRIDIKTIAGNRLIGTVGTTHPMVLEANANARFIVQACNAYQELRDLLAEASNVLGRYADVNDGSDGQPQANAAMSLEAEIDRVLAQLDAAEKAPA